jgi:hypothetical protein
MTYQGVFELNYEIFSEYYRFPCHGAPPLPINGNVVVEAYAGTIPEGVPENDVPPTEYSVNIFYNGELVKKFVIYSSTDFGIVSNDANHRRSLQAQMAIYIAQYICTVDQFYIIARNIQLVKRFSTDIPYLEISLPEDFERIAI